MVLVICARLCISGRETIFRTSTSLLWYGDWLVSVSYRNFPFCSLFFRSFSLLNILIKTNVTHYCSYILKQLRGKTIQRSLFLTTQYTNLPYTVVAQCLLEFTLCYLTSSEELCSTPRAMLFPFFRFEYFLVSLKLKQ